MAAVAYVAGGAPPSSLGVASIETTGDRYEASLGSGTPLQGIGMVFLLVGFVAVCIKWVKRIGRAAG